MSSRLRKSNTAGAWTRSRSARSRGRRGRSTAGSAAAEVIASQCIAPGADSARHRRQVPAPGPRLEPLQPNTPHRPDQLAGQPQIGDEGDLEIHRAASDAESVGPAPLVVLARDVDDQVDLALAQDVD